MTEDVGLSEPVNVSLITSGGSLVPRPFCGGGKNGLVYTVCALFPQKQGNSCTFENPPLNSNVILRCIILSLARNTAVLAAVVLCTIDFDYTMYQYCTVLYCTIVLLCDVNGVEQ